MREYFACLLMLKALIIVNQGQSAEAAMILDKMDMYWSSLSPEKQEDMRQATVTLEQLATNVLTP